MARPSRARRGFALAAASIILAGGSNATGARAADDDPFALLREEQIVTGATKRPQPLSETPSSVSIVTAAEIRAQGFHTLADALRWVRGLYVTYDRNYSYVGVRGLLRPGDYNNKVLLTMDGHALNGSVFGDALFGSELGLDMENVERIEVVRGPGSALYGSDAVLAVVNVVTRPPNSQPGLTAAARGGHGRERRGFTSLAWSRPGWPQWSVAGSWLDARGVDLYYPEYAPPLGGSGAALGADGERAGDFYGSAEWAGTRLAVKWNRREKQVPTGSFDTDFGDPRNRTTDGHDFVELSALRRPAPSLELNLRGYWDAARYRGDYLYGSVVDRDIGEGDTYGTEGRANWSPDARQVVTAGLEARWHVRRLLRNYDVDPYALHLDRNPDGGENAFYLQDELRLPRGVRVTAGARADNDSRFEPVVSPRLDALWRQSERTRWSILVGSAFRAPTVYETDYDAPPQIGNAALSPERVTSIEASVVHRVGPASATLCAYRNDVRNLIDLEEVDTLGTLQYRNRQRVRSVGIEGELEAVAGPDTRVRLALAWQDSRAARTTLGLTNSPRWNGHFLLSHAPAQGPLSAGLGVRWMSRRGTLAGSLTAPAVVTDARLGYAPAPRVAVALEVRNLLDSRYGDPASGEHAQDQIQQDSRSLYLTLTLLPGMGR